MEQIRTQLEQELFKLSDEGWSYILAELGEQHSFNDIKRFVLETDLKKIAEPSIPKDLKKLQNGEINERLVLQITSIVDVSTPKARRERRGLDPHRPHLCVVNFSDGHSTLHGIEYHPITDMHTLSSGAKVVIQRAVIRGGYLLLDPHSFSAVLFRGHHEQLVMRKQGEVTGTQGPPPFTALPVTESRVSHVTDQRRDQRNNNQDKKGNNNARPKNDSKPGQDKANNSNAKNGNNNRSNNKQNNSNNNTNDSNDTGANHAKTNQPNAKNNQPKSENRTRNNNTNNSNNSTNNTNTNKNAHNTHASSNTTNNSTNSNNNKSATNNNNRNNNKRHNATDSQSNTSRPQSDSRTHEAKNRSITSVKTTEYKPKNDTRPVNETPVKQNTAHNNTAHNNTAHNNTAHNNTAHNNTAHNNTAHNNTRNKTQPNTRTDRAVKQNNSTKYAPKTETHDNRRQQKPVHKKSEVTDNSAYYQSITPLLQALVTFRPPQHSEAAFMSVQVTLTRVMLSSVTLMNDTLVCLALSDALTVLQVGCELTLLADILGVTPDNVPLVLQTAYQVIGAAAQPVYHLVAPVQINQPMNMIAGYIMLTDIEL